MGKSLFVTILEITLILIVVPQTSVSQSLNYYGGTYTNKVGEQAVYQFSNLWNFNKNSSYWQLKTIQGDSKVIEIFNDMIFTVTIRNIQKTVSNENSITEFYIQTKFLFPNGTNVVSDIYLDNEFNFLTFQSKKDAVSYVKQLEQKNPYYSKFWSVDDNYIEETWNATHKELSYGNLKYNWHTGWLQSSDISVCLECSGNQNKSLLTKITFTKLESNTSNYESILKFSLLSISMIGVISIAVVYNNYRKNAKKSQNVPFNRYLKEKIVKKRRTKSESISGNIDKSLEMIDDILRKS